MLGARSKTVVEVPWPHSNDANWIGPCVYRTDICTSISQRIFSVQRPAKADHAIYVCMNPYLRALFAAVTSFAQVSHVYFVCQVRLPGWLRKQVFDPGLGENLRKHDEVATRI